MLILSCLFILGTTALSSFGTPLALLILSLPRRSDTVSVSPSQERLHCHADRRAPAHDGNRRVSVYAR